MDEHIWHTLEVFSVKCMLQLTFLMMLAISQVFHDQ